MKAWVRKVDARPGEDATNPYTHEVWSQGRQSSETEDLSESTSFKLMKKIMP